MSETIQFDYDQVRARLERISREYDALLPSLFNLQQYVEEAYEESDIKFLKAASDLLDQNYIQMRKIAGYVEEAREATSRYHREVESYAAGE